MRPPRASTIFLERAPYQRRRLRDTLRVLPIAGLLLLLVPVFWPTSGPGAFRTSSALIYVFLAWALLIVLSFAISRRLAQTRPEEDDSDADV